MGNVLEFLARNWALMSIATTLVLLVVFPAMILRKYVHIALNILDELSPPVWPESREAGPIEGEPVAFNAFDGHALRGTMLPAGPHSSRNGAVIFAHEFGMDRWTYHRYGRPLREAGFDVFIFDFRGHGESPPEEGYKPRQFPSDREYADMLGAIAYVEQALEEQGRPREVGLFGLSRGGGAAILAAVGIDSVKAIAVDGAYSSDRLVEYHLKRWACIFAKLRFVYENHPPTFWRFLRWLIMQKAEAKFNCRYPSVYKALKRLRSTPLLFIHGERDTYIPVEQAQMLYHVAAGPKYLWTVPGARHNQSVNQCPGQYARRIVGFFDTHLAHRPTGGRTRPSAFDSSLLGDLVQPIADVPAPQRDVDAPPADAKRVKTDAR